jgi:phosphoribosyl 1,2-cyclic phosphodiesterase
VVALLEHETLDGKDVIAIFGPGQALDPEAGIVPQQVVTIEATVRDNGRAAADSASEDAEADSDATLAPVGVAAEAPATDRSA